jgi:molybdenum cofactor biosynthesis enzyme MoaA
MIPHSTTFDYSSEFDQWSADNQHLCVIPYSYVGVHVGQKKQDPCCWYRSTGDNPIAEVKNNIESGKIDKNCQLCHTQEANNQFSGRQRALAQLNHHELPEFLITKKIDTFFMFITFSNKCNMACRICNPGTSSLYDSIWNNNKVEPKSIRDDPTYFEIIKADIRNKIDQYKSLRLFIMGGEGTVQSDLYMLTDWLQEENLSKKIDLQIGTNGSVFLDETFSSWCNNFKSLSFGISIDSTDEDNFVYVRYPVKFEKIHNNLQKFKLLAETHSNVDFDIRPTFYINNIAYLKEFLDYFEKFRISNRNIRIFDNTLTHCDHLSLLALPSYLRKKLSEQIQEILSHNYSLFIYNPVFKKSIQSFLDQLTSNDFLETNWTTYISTTARWDGLTDTNLSINNKKLWDLLSDEDKNAYYRHTK